MPDINLLFNSLEDNDWESDDSDSSSVVTIPDDEIPNYFAHYNGRLYPSRSFFHSYGSAPYPLPCDANEQEVRFLFFPRFCETKVAVFTVYGWSIGTVKVVMRGGAVVKINLPYILSGDKVFACCD